MLLHLVCWAPLALPSATPTPAAATQDTAFAPAQEQPLVQTQDRAPAGRWEGRIEGAKLDVEVTLRWESDTLVGTIDIPTQGLVGGALVDVTSDGREVHFRMADTPGDPTFVGVLDEGGGRLTGTFTQGGGKLKFALERAVPTQARADALLAGFDDWVTKQLRRQRVPGLTAAVVWRGEVVLARGYGVADVETGAPVTADTLFAIGSTTKAFTTFALAQAVEEGVMDWDAPVRRWLPELDLVDDVAEQALSLRDMCSHRSGLPRHDLVWYANPDVTRTELVARLAHLEPSEAFRAVWQYNNLMFAAAGVALERATGTSWEDRVRGRILAPLGMGRTSFGFQEALARGDAAKPHDRKRGKDVVVPFRDLTQIGPAGSIHSSANDMARWAKMLLARGEVGGQRLLSLAKLAELATPVSVMGEPGAPTAYGLGWMIDTFEGHPRVHHGGAIDGFTTMLELYPDDRLAVFISTNRASALTNLAAKQLAQRMLGLTPTEASDEDPPESDAGEEIAANMRKARESERVAGTSPARPLDAYAGTYRHPGYGTLVVSVVDGTLRLAYGVAEAPLEHWHYEAFRCAEADRADVLEGLLVLFRDDLGGFIEVAELQLDQASAPVRFERQPDQGLLEEALVARLVGEYTLLGQRLVVERSGVALTLTVQGQPAIALKPATHGRYALDVADGYWLRFELPGDGPAGALVLTQPNGVFRAERRTP